MHFWGMAALAGMLLASADTAPMELSGDFTMAGTIAGTPARIHLDPGAPSMPILHPDFVARTHPDAGPFDIRAMVGPIKAKGQSAVLRFDLGQEMGGGEFKRRTAWFDAPFFAASDATIGPGGVPAEQVRFVLREPRPGERETSLPLKDYFWAGMAVETQIGDEKMIVRFSLDRAVTIATAGAGAALAETHGGKFDTPPAMMPIFLGVERPVRHMVLATPYEIGPFRLTGFNVRTGDFGSTAGVADANAPEPDPDEIIVTGAKKVKRRLRIEIARDQLSRCSSILFDKPGKRIVFTCS